MYTTVVTRSIGAAHRNGPPGGRCDTMHGHTWKFTVTLSMLNRMLDEYGWSVDFGAIKSLIDRWDHQTLNTFTTLPSAENLAKMLYDDIQLAYGPKLWTLRVRVQEAPGMHVEYEGPDLEDAPTDESTTPKVWGKVYDDLAASDF